MVTRLESREQNSGIRPLHVNKDVALVFSGRSYLENLDYLIEVASLLAHRNIGWSEEAARSVMTRAMRVNRLTGGKELSPDIIDMILDNPNKAREIPSAILFRKETAQPGSYLGITVQRMFYVQTEQAGEIPAFYHVLRAFEKEHRGRHRGRFSVELALAIHNEAQVYMHRSTNPMALYTNTKSPALVQEGRHPLDTPFSEDPVAFEVAKEVVKIVSGDQAVLEPTGVVRGAYPEPNSSYIEDPSYTETYELYLRMKRSKEKGGWAMNFPNGDALISYYRVK